MQIRHVLELLGLVSIGIGCWLIFPPTVWIYAGVATWVFIWILLITTRQP